MPDPSRLIAVIEPIVEQAGAELVDLEVAGSHGRPVVFIYPSSIAAYGIPDVASKERAGRVKEDEWMHPRTMS